MKSLSLYFFALLTTTVASQSFLPMLVINHSWSIDLISEPLGGGAQSIYTLQLSLTGIETYNGVDYFVVTNQNGDTSCRVREVDGFVYRYDIYDNEEWVMYDFTLNVGDEFMLNEIANNDRYCGIGSLNNYLKSLNVIDVTTEYIANQNRKICSIPQSVKDISALQVDPSVITTSIKIYNIIGVLIDEKELINGATSIHAMHYASGLYIYTVQNKKEIVASKKFVFK